MTPRLEPPPHCPRCWSAITAPRATIRTYETQTRKRVVREWFCYTCTCTFDVDVQP